MTRWLLVLMLMTTAFYAGGERLAMAASIVEVKSKHESRLLSLPGVISVGIGRDDDGRTVIVIGVRDEVTAKSKDLPEQLEGYPVQVDVIGPVQAQ
ncbi:MAG TPA: hypothetical protein ENI97_07475 [Gammaproteobacteria bacterium]|nr:hypothetical protein [Gammaproteobacteria bacterium]